MFICPRCANAQTFIDVCDNCLEENLESQHGSNDYIIEGVQKPLEMGIPKEEQDTRPERHIKITEW